MANSTAKFLADALLTYLKGTAVATAFAATSGTGDATLTTSYIGLFSTTPTANTGSGTEISGSSYARVAYTNSGNWSAISQSADTIHDQISNSAAITFPAVTTTPYTVVGVGVWDSPSQVSAPAAPSATGNTGTGSSFTASQTCNVAVSYVTQGGETTVSANTLVTISSSGDNIVVTLPTFPAGVTGMNVYVSTANGGGTLNRVGSGVTSTTSAGTVTVTNFSSTGVAVPGANTSAGNLLYYIAVTSQAVSVGNQYQLGAGQLVVEV